MRIPETYELIQQETLKECHSEAYLLRHIKTGASLYLLANQDPNKVFTIGFRTPPADSTGLPHILEHSVLCGSRKFPVKDPFIELEKSSLQTFLNAMTYPDKTIYPVASCNDKDFQNLMDVYMDAVLHPAIYDNEKIFRQEGWHYEIEDAQGPVTVNGVVYNEMKGAFSSPEDVLERYCQTVLFPDTPYTHESGGDPEVIPSLSYEDFLNFHSTYYHPSNSYIYLYGNMDMTEKLEWLDREYLSEYDYKEVDSHIAMQAPFETMADVTIPYSVAEGEDDGAHAFLSQHWVTGTITDPVLYVAFQILETALLTAPGAPLKQALMDAGIGADVFGGYQNGCLQPYFSIVAKHASLDQKEEFLKVIRETLEQQVRDGMDHKALQAALNTLDFKNREADYGPYPRGLMAGIECFDSWLYDASPSMHLKYEETFDFLKEQLDQGYFEGLIQKYFLANEHQAVLVLKPETGLTEKKEEELAEKMRVFKESLTPEQVQELVDQTAALKAYQSEPSTEEQLATLPSLNLSDIDPKAEELHNCEKMIDETPVLHHEMETNGIYYMRVLFRADNIEKEEIPYLGLLRSLLLLLPTENYSYTELFQEVSLESGGIGNSIPVFASVEESSVFAPYMEIHGRILKDHRDKAMELMQEILLRTNFRDEKRLRELLMQFKTRAVTQLSNHGHSTALLRAVSYASPVSWFNDQVGGVDYYRFLEATLEHFEQSQEARQELMERLESLSRKLFTQNGMLVSITSTEEDYGAFEESFRNFRQGFPMGEAASFEDPYRKSRSHWEIVTQKKQEGFRTAAQIQYVACAGNFRKAGYEYTGALRVLRSILADEYLWINVRVKGGAYGCMCSFGRSGSGYFVSYRDPNLGKTLETYRAMVPWLETLELSERDMNNYIIGTIGTMDRPMNPSESGSLSFQAYMGKITPEMIQKERDQVLSCNLETIRGCAPMMQAILDDNQLCVVGNAGKIDQEKELFLHLENLGGKANEREDI